MTKAKEANAMKRGAVRKWDGFALINKHEDILVSASMFRMKKGSPLWPINLEYKNWKVIPVIITEERKAR